MSDGVAPITGEHHPFSLRSALDALASFYLAFNTRDLDLMEAVWLGGREPSMDNPIGGIRRGWEEIRLGYQKLFSGPAQVHVEFYDYSIHEYGTVAVVVGRERGWCQTPAGRMDLQIRTSRIFVRKEGEWKQLHHHGSIEFPAMLARYQELILGAQLAAKT
jgi:ketosteroid isomerase-like protein